ncbi:unnamed protein product [Rotaria sp. Silwood2]|nr:unnamed protein product [Rotaria sp. Silwood2]
MAIWWLTCLMLSACSSLTIADALFSLMLSRFRAHFEELGNHLFLIAGCEYYLQLTNIQQQRQFEQIFINESNPEKLYADLFAHIQNTILSSSWIWVWMCGYQVLNNNGLLNNNTPSDSNEFDANNISPINDE